jgi:hypothetical protein
MSEKAGENQEAIGGMQEYPPIWDTIDMINAKPSELGLKAELSNIVRSNNKERLDVPERRAWLWIKRYILKM